MGKTAVNVADAACLVAFAEGRHGLVERLSPVNDAPLREVLGHLVALGNALTLTDGSLQQSRSGPGASGEGDETQRKQESGRGLRLHVAQFGPPSSRRARRMTAETEYLRDLGQSVYCKAGP